MPASFDPSATMILADLAEGDPSAAQKLFPCVYDELRRLAGAFFRHQPAAHTLQPTALVHEAYIKMIDVKSIDDKIGPSYNSRAHFFSVAAKAMRHILIDRARRVKAKKHGGGLHRITLDEGAVSHGQTEEMDLLKLDEILKKLEALDERKAKIVELRFFAGLGIEETAEALGIARSTVTEDWRMAKAWLAVELRDGNE